MVHLLWSFRIYTVDRATQSATFGSILQFASGGGKRVYEQLLWSIRRRLWLVVSIAIATVICAFIWAETRPDYYEAEGSYLVQPRTLDADDEVRAIEALASSEGITSTYTSIAESDRIVAVALAELGLEDGDRVDLEVQTSVASGTNILKVGARGRDPVLTRDMAAVVGDLTTSYVNELNDVFVLSTLDEPRLPTDATGAPTGLIVVAALVVGAGLGVLVALVTERISPATPRPWVRRMRDRSSGAYHKRYLKVRLGEEISRSRAGGHSFSLGVLHVMRPGRGSDQDAPAELSEEDLVGMASRIQSSLRDHDILGHLGGGRFAAILPGMEMDDARRLVEHWRSEVTGFLIDRPLRSDVAISTGVCAYDSSAFVGDPDAERVAAAL